MPSDSLQPRSPQARAAGPFRVRMQALTLTMRLRQLARRCRFGSGVIALMPRPLDVIAKSMNDLAAKAKRFAKAAAMEREDFESHYRDNRKLAIACCWELASAIESDNERTAYEFACACLRTNRSKRAQTILEALAASDNKTSRYVIAAKCRLARVAWKLGDGEAAVKTLRAVRSRAARKQYHSWLGILTVRNGLLLGESGDAESAGAVLMGGLLASGMDHRFARGVTEIYLMAACWKPFETLTVTMPPSNAPATQPQLPTPIILSGFGWSGSGAVADFLKGHPQVADVFSGREMGLWTGRYGLDRLYAHFASKGFNRRLLLEFLTRHCFGHSFLADSRGTKSLGGMWAWLDETQRWKLLEALASWLAGMRKWKRDSAQPLLEEFQKLSARLLSFLANPETTCVLLSNCVPSDAIVGIRMFETPAVIVSWRDPGDAYASKKAAFPDNALEFHGWKNQLMARIDRYLAGKAEVAHYSRLWLDLSFEEFVLSEPVRRQLLELLGLDEHTMKSTFDPTVSARNIGILRPLSGKNRSAWNALAIAVDSARCEAKAISKEGPHLLIARPA